ncbi:MAG: ATP-binding cassette domain-containing protein [Coriobacteriales bacterium]|jgi:alpha-D-ribose 1-methylphosphonate 5-triphosphate synthase subunit PhnL|nr:ATP-binding cassette domain-containing protein [Coriobacteriales bacterium]
MSELLRIEGLSKRFYLHQARRGICGCEDINLTVHAGEFVGITGKSGSGKSTILRGIYRTNLPQQGRIWYDSAGFGLVDICRVSERQMIYLRRFEIGYISQFLQVLPRTTAFDVVAQSALDAYGDGDLCRAQRETERLLRHFELAEELWGLYPLTFSGGEKLRLNIAAAMIKEPRLLLLDEPTASLDNASKRRVRELIERLKQGGCTMLGIFHDLEFMEGLCDREFNMEEGYLEGTSKNPLHTSLRPICPQPVLSLNGISPASPIKSQNGLGVNCLALWRTSGF